MPNTEYDTEEADQSSKIFPSVEMVTTCQGIDFPLA